MEVYSNEEKNLNGLFFQDQQMKETFQAKKLMINTSFKLQRERSVLVCQTVIAFLESQCCCHVVTFLHCGTN